MAPAVVAGDLRDIRPLVAAHVAFERSAVAIPTDWAERTARLIAVGHLAVFVAEAHRGGGVGRLLLDAATHQARSRGHRELQWQTPQWNTAAIGFYERLGATHTSKERFTLALP